MILVTGGLGSGIRPYVRTLGYTDADMASERTADAPVLLDAQELARVAEGEQDAPAAFDAAALADELAAGKRIVVCRDVGSGVVPIGRDERAWRERAGALAQELARRASAVVRMTCGIPQAIKGELPPDGVQVVIMRHSRTEANERHAYAGTIDTQLTEQGRAQAVQAGVCPQVTEVFVSSLSRARDTAAICFPEARQVVDDGLREMNFGVFEGRSAADMEDDEQYRAWVDSYCEDRCPGGEQRSELTQRVGDAVERIVRAALQRGERRVVIVGHGGTIMAAMDRFCPTERGYFEWHAGNCGGYRSTARFRDGALSLEDEQEFSDLSFINEGDDAHPQAGASFFTNRACPYFPCHEGIDERDFNCLFCYCPLYALGPDCGGNFTYTKKGRKNCKGCALPHMRENGVDLVVARYERLADLARRRS